MIEGFIKGVICLVGAAFFGAIATGVGGPIVGGVVFLVALAIIAKVTGTE